MKKKYTAKEVKELILDSATEQFIQNGFDKTRVQDIMQPLDGLTKGAFYHHFESKDEVADKTVERLFPDRLFLDGIVNDPSLSGLRKIQELFLISMFHESTTSYISNSFGLLSSPRFFLKYIDYVNITLVPYLEIGLKEGKSDGSLEVEYISQTAELIVLVLSTWFLSAIFPNTVDTMNEKIIVSQQFLKNSGLNILDDYVIQRMSEEIQKSVQND